MIIYEISRAWFHFVVAYTVSRFWVLCNQCISRLIFRLFTITVVCFQRDVLNWQKENEDGLISFRPSRSDAGISEQRFLHNGRLSSVSRSG